MIKEEVEKAAIEAHVIDYITSHADDYFPLKKKSRQSKKRPNYWDSVWGKLLLDPNIENPNSGPAKKFRRRFRVPYPLFKDVIVPQCDEKNVFTGRNKFSIPTCHNSLQSFNSIAHTG